MYLGVHNGAEQEKCGICPYDDKRYFLADMPDNRLNSKTHANVFRDFAADKHLVADQPEPGAELIIRHFEKQFIRRHARMTRRFELAGTIKMEEELFNVDAAVELNGDQL